MDYIFRKINMEEYDKLYDMFPGDYDTWLRCKNIRIKDLENKKIDIYVIEYENKFIGELTINYINHDLETETIPNIRVYLQAFRIDKKYQGLGLGQKLIEYTISDLENKGYTEFTIGVEDDNERAKHIYFKYGFTDAIDYGHGDEFDPTDYTLYLRKKH